MVAKHLQLDLARKLLPVAERRPRPASRQSLRTAEPRSVLPVVSEQHDTLRQRLPARRGKRRSRRPDWGRRPLDAQALDGSGEPSGGPVGFHGKDGSVGLHEDPLGVAAEDEFANLAPVPQADDDEGASASRAMSRNSSARSYW